jgi:hypothetical protein
MAVDCAVEQRLTGGIAMQHDGSIWGGSSEIENSMVFRLFIAGAMSRWHRNNVLLRPVTGSVVVRRWQVACVVWRSGAVPADDMWDQGGLS